MAVEFPESAGIVRAAWPDWEVTGKLGSGAFATVYRASRREKIPGEKDSAIKVIRIPGSDDDWEALLAEGRTPDQAEAYLLDVVDDSLREIRAMEELSGNTNIVSIFDYKVYKSPDRPVRYILIRMEYLQKADAVSFGEEEIIRLGTDVCTALSLCRKKNIVHRDVSLDNIFIHDGNYKLGDFGVAKVLEGAVGTMRSIAGKPLYMAPEVYSGSLDETDIDSAAKVDIYSLGILMYRLASGMKYPFENPDQENVSARERNQAFRRRIIDKETLPPPKNASPELAAMILKACSWNPADRYESAEAMKQDLLALTKNRDSVPSGPARKTAPWIFASSAALVLLILAALFILKPGQHTTAVPEWSEWSDWSETSPEIPDPEAVEAETKERFEWSAVRCSGCGAHNPAAAQACANCGQVLSPSSEVLKQYTDDSAGRLDRSGIRCRDFDGFTYWYSGSVTLFRTRSRTSEIRTEKSAGVPGVDDFCHIWYFASVEDSERYPGTVFMADGPAVYITISRPAEDDSQSSSYGPNTLIVRGSRYVGSSSVRYAEYVSGTLSVSPDRFTLEDGKLVSRSGTLTETYTLEFPKQQIPFSLSDNFAEALRPDHFDGTWDVVQCGFENTFADAEALNVSGEAIIRDGRLSMSWIRNGERKSLELTFDPELKNGCLYANPEGLTSYTVSMREDRTILLSIGRDETQWVLRNRNRDAGDIVHPVVPGFEAAFAAGGDWSVSAEKRDELAGLLMDAALAGGVDSSRIRWGGAFCLSWFQGLPAYPFLVCEGTGDRADYLLKIGRGVNSETREPFVYYSWVDVFRVALEYPETNLLDYYRENLMYGFPKDQIWTVRVSPD